MKIFRYLPDQRHDILDILFLAATSVISGAEGWKDIKGFSEEKIIDRD